MPKHKRKITEKQRNFVDLYWKLGNATEAYLQSSYKDTNRNSASARASQLLSKSEVLEYLNELKEKAEQKTTASAARIIQELEKVAFGSVGDVVQVDENGNVEMKSEADLSLLDSISFSKSTTDSADGSTSKAKSFSIKKSDKMKALIELAKIKGLYDDGNDNDESGKNSVNAARNMVKALRKLGAGRKS